MDTVIVIIGSTASGKTQLSIELAKRLGSEIISADSMQIYKYMDIGTAKPDIEEMAGIKHYLIDEIYPDEEFSVARFKELADKYIEEILKNGKIPIVVGGTGLYINSLIYNISFSETVSNWEFREKLRQEAEIHGSKSLHDRLKAVDPQAADKIHENNVKRVIRALEVYEYTKTPISHHQEISRTVLAKYRFAVIGLRMDRQLLYERINKRVDVMLERGLVDEVKALKEKGYDRSTIAMQGLGYKEILAYLNGENSLEAAVENIKQGTRHYAKRQITWFKRLENVHWIDVDRCEGFPEILEIAKDYIETYGIFL